MKITRKILIFSNLMYIYAKRNVAHEKEKEDEEFHNDDKGMTFNAF